MRPLIPSICLPALPALCLPALPALYLLALSALGLLTFPALCLAQSTWYVPDDFTTIQGAIDNAASGDTIIVRPGTYEELVRINGKTLILESEGGPAVTTIKAKPQDTVVKLEGYLGHDTVFRGFTVTNGFSATHGGGIYCEGSPLIEKNIITSNHADYQGAGILCAVDSSPIIHDNLITENGIINGGGGGIYCDEYAGPFIVGNRISKNKGYNLSGAGGGIYCDKNSTPFITDNIICDNEAVYRAGGIFCEGEAVIVNNLIYGNSTPFGGGIYCTDTYAFITNNTIVDNEGVTEGGGIYVKDCAPTVSNNILWSNQAVTYPEIATNGSAAPAVFYCNVQGGWPGTGNINLDPLFVDALNRDYHLRHTSPCRNAGDNGPVASGGDFEGDPRIADGVADMGADEFYPHIYITGDKTPGGSIDLKLISPPGTTPAAFFMGTSVWETPLNWWPYGVWFLMPPAFGPFMVGPLPSPHGVAIMSGTIPLLPGGPYTIYFHGLLGSTSTNLERLNIE